MVVAPTVATALGLIFAVLTERIRWGTAFKLVVFMPMAISMLAAGIIFRLVYEQDPDRGVANAVWVGVHDTFAEPPAYPERPPAPEQPPDRGAGRLVPSPSDRSGRAAGVDCRWSACQPAGHAERRAGRQAPPRAEPGEVTGTVWLDFTRGGGGKPATSSTRARRRWPGIKVEAVKDGKVVATATGGRRRHVHPARPRPTVPSSGCPRSNFDAAVQRRRLARPDPGHPGDHRQRTSGCGPASRWC